MELKELKELAFACAEQAAAKNLAEFSIESADFSIRVATHAPAAASAALMQAAVNKPVEEKVEEASEVYTGTVVTAPLVGTYYAAAAPDEPPYITVGQQVKKGEPLFIIEAMKTMNDITAPCDGVISRILAQNGDMVEYKQPLVVIE